MFYTLKSNGGKHLLTVTTQKCNIFTDSTKIILHAEQLDDKLS